MAAQSSLASLSRLRSWTNKQSQDKLKFFRFGVPRLREAFRLFTAEDPINELYMRKPNRSGGTHTMAAFGLAIVQKRQELDGVRLPQWKGPIEAVQFVTDYKRQLLSVQPAYQKLLAGWPHKMRSAGSAITDIRVMPVGGDPEDFTKWSIIHFISEDNPKAAVGIRADLALFDEPPPIGILQEMRKAAHAGRRSIRVIAATPVHMKEWAPLLADYGDGPRSAIRRVDRWRAEVRWSLDEVESWVLSDEEKQEMREAYWDKATGKARDLIAEARWHGDYTNAEGSSPWGDWGTITLMRMLKDCVAPSTLELPIPMETEDGTPVKITRVKVEFWKPADGKKRYYEPIDPSSGVDDGKHHEAALHMAEVGSGNLVARWNGYLQPYQLGVLGAAIGRQYNTAAADVETMDHWGVNVVRGFEASRYPNLAFEQRELRPGVWAKEVGYRMNEEAKRIVIGQIQEWLAAWGAYYNDIDKGLYRAKPYCEVLSADVITNLLACELDERGKIVAGPGLAHGHDVILLGMTLRRAVLKSNLRIPGMNPREVHPDANLIARIQGQAKPVSLRILPKPRSRSRV